MKIRVCVAQYNVPDPAKDSIAKLKEIAEKASNNGAKLLVAPETAIGLLADVKNIGVDYLPELKNITKQNSIYLATTFYKKENNQYFNQGYIISDKGEVALSHRKIYLAPPEREQDGISPGGKLSVSKTELGKLRMLICKDGFNRYSHFLYEKLNQLEVDIICIPTWSLGNFEVDTREYVKALFVYGAFASRSFVLVSGNLNKSTKSFGRSLIISPINGVLQEVSVSKEEYLIQELDLDEVKRAREFDSWWQPKERLI